MPVYPCPECGAQLRPANPVPAGKKLRCPKCETVFAPTGAAKAAKPAAKPAAAPAPADEEGGSYGLVREDEDKHAEARREQAFDKLRDRFERSKRGPALVQVVRPSDWLLRVGVLTCVMSLVGSMWSIWPLIFKVEIVQPEDKMAKFKPPTDSGRRFKELSEDEWKERWLFLGGFVFQLEWGGVVCAGATKMHSLESYPLAMIGSVMSIAGPGLPAGIGLLNYALNNDEQYYVFVAILLIGVSIPISLWCIATLRKKEVIEGFAEEKPEDY